MPLIANRANFDNDTVLGDGMRGYALTCRTGGVAVSTVEWFHNGNQLDKNNASKYQTNLLTDFTVLNVELADEGVYNCTFNNGMPGQKEYCLEIEGGCGAVCLWAGLGLYCGRGRIL